MENLSLYKNNYESLKELSVVVGYNFIRNEKAKSGIYDAANSLLQLEPKDVTKSVWKGEGKMTNGQRYVVEEFWKKVGEGTGIDFTTEEFSYLRNSIPLAFVFLSDLQQRTNDPKLHGAIMHMANKYNKSSTKFFAGKFV